MKEKQQGILIGIFLATMVFCAMGATVYKTLVGTGSPTANSIVVWDGVNGNRVKYSGITINTNNDVSGINILSIGLFAPDSPLSKIYGGTEGTNNETIQASLGLVPGLDIQAYSVSLLQIATIGVSSGDFLYYDGSNMTNFGSTVYGRAVLAASSYANALSTIGGVALAGSTMTGPLLVPYIQYNANLTNAGSNYVLTAKAVAEKIEQMSVGSTFFSAVSSDFTNSAGTLEFAPEATAGTGKILRESAAGTNQQFSGLSDVSVTDPVTGQIPVYDGSTSNWVNGISSRMDLADYWIEIFTGIFGRESQIATALDQFSSGGLNNGTAALSPNYADRNGVVTLSTRNTTDLYTGAAVYFAGGATVLNPTNTLHFRSDIILIATNEMFARIGFTDQMNSNTPTDTLHIAITNGLAVGEACQGGFANRTQTATSFQCVSNVWYNFKVFMTNSVAWFRIYTNRTQLAWEDSVSSNVPGTGQFLSPTAFMEGTGPTSTNLLIMGIDTIGFRYSVQ